MNYDGANRGTDHRPLDLDVQRHIGSELQNTFSEIEKGPLPDHHVELLLALRRVERELQREQK
ncbi:hypothetical protein [Microvirga pudoricolor]|uniref:hypothetical protein n=1 Tax=Microvirga pudoricolor TaxID=2778729 RepID=UPI0019522E2D|nr:hypothetical protein [Microvirga pudoricolor]MBM6594393.1 hypothetical protein [Microvirga pudoricolor]